jgi:Pyruvate/2-oxoacid:ferredoxin oxidoreductase delta subunit
MGHMIGKDVYRQLGRKIDGLPTRVPWTEAFHAILRELYTTEEADLVVRMPFGVASLDKIARVTGYNTARLEGLLDSLSEKGLVMDIEVGRGRQYMVSPLIVGIFEFTMMRTRGELDTETWARLFHEYLDDPETFYKANCGHGEHVSPLRALPHDGTVNEGGFVEVFDYESANAIAEEAKRFAIGICSCRHEKLHLGTKSCDAPLDTCATFGAATDYMIRHGFAREVSKTQMLENNARSREMGLVFCADNVKNDVSFLCHCCGCCCNVLLGVSKFGYLNALVTSNFIAKVDTETCAECETCVDACPVKAISAENGGPPRVDEKACLGCGVCAVKCSTESLKLVSRKKRVLYPEDTFERVILQALERGTLQNLLFDNPQSTTHGFMRAFVGGFLKLPPVKKSLMSDTLRSRFLTFMRKGG